MCPARPLPAAFQFVLLLFVGLCLTGLRTAYAQAPLHERIDAAIEAKLEGTPAPPASDAEFLRRVYLDLSGSIPPLAEAQSFLDDPASDKRQRLIDRLLTSASYARRMQYVFDVMLMQRRNDKHVPAEEWEGWLYDSFAENKPYDQMAREILSADGTSPEFRGPAKFYLDREAEPNLLTRDVGRLFLGRDMQCAQCHDHPLIDGYKQDHYYGLLSFFSRSYLYTDRKQKRSFLAEKGEGDVTFKSVFDPTKTTYNTGPHLIDAAVIAEPKFEKGQEYYVAPAKDVRPVPKFSRREQLAGLAAGGESPDFNRNIANRLWALMMGRGLVDPVDLHHADNPPSHPELLDMLSAEFVAMKFDIKAFVRELALTRTYQRSSEIPAGMSDEQAAPATFAVAALKPLSPEQLGFSVLEASGVTEPQRAAEHARVESDPRLTAIFQIDEPRLAVKEALVEKSLHEKLKGNLKQFVSLYGSSPGEPEQDFQATVQQALFVSNGPVIKGFINSGAAGIAPRLAAKGDMKEAVDELYLSVLSRYPSDEERLEATEYLIRQGDRRQAMEDMAWALLASAEFRFNH